MTFEPGARTAWHTHPLGQTLMVTAWLGTSATMGRPDRRNSPWGPCLVPAVRKTLERCRPKTAMTHIAIQEQIDGRAVDCLEHFTEERYGS